jgi:glycosyltransferase involved in cell wall biosynthesis
VGSGMISSSINECESNEKIFFFPALPRVFKNFEVIFEAFNQIYMQEICNIRLVVTFDGTENKYSKHLRCKYAGNPIISFAGRMSTEQIKGMYNTCSALLFPSMLETWGLPISEFKSYKKPMLLADLPYAYETMGEYESAIFINPVKPEDWAKTILSIVDNKTHFIKRYKTPVQTPFCENWIDLWRHITEGL